MKYYTSTILRQVKSHLKNGGVIAYPTEYCFGLGCDPFNYKAINKIIALKKRNKTKGMIVVSSNIKQLKQLIKPLSITDQQELLNKYWPGPTTLIMSIYKKNLIPSNLIGEHNKIAVRVTTHTLIKQLCDYLDSPLVSTSANLSGFLPAKTYKECKKIFGEKVMVLPGCTGFARHPSRILDLESGKILR